MRMQIFTAVIFAAVLFLGMLSCLRIGWLLGRRRLRVVGDDASSGLGAVDGAIFGLMGLLIAFTFTGALTRFDHRRDLITAEVNAIGTAWLRLDLLDTEARGEVQDLFRQYLDARIGAYARVNSLATATAGLKQSNALQKAIWQRLIVAAQRDPTPRVASTVLPPVNEMFDLANTRLLATRQHPPTIIYLMLGFLVLVCALLAGFSMAKSKSQSWLHLVGFAAVVSASVYLILDMEYPRLGLVRVDSFDAAFVTLRESMN
jgi:hypothetical protein